MPDPMDPAQIAPLHASGALRALARAFGRFEDFDAFVAALEGALSRGGLGRIRLDLGEGDAGAERFVPHHLTLPLSAGAASAGVLRVGGADERRSFGAEDLHLLAGLADLVGAVLLQARRTRDAARARDLLSLMLDQAPVGIAAYAEDFSPVVANRLAVRWLGGETRAFDRSAAESGAFQFRVDGTLVHGEARKISAKAGALWILVLHDLGPEQGRFMDAMQRDLYRALARKEPFALALIEAPASGPGGALRCLGALRGGLGAGERAGPYDATRAALVVGAGGAALRARLRRLRPLLGEGVGVRVGYAELGRDGEAPEDLLEAALGRSEEFDLSMRPTLLVHGESAAVADSFALALGREFRVLRSDTVAEARDRLRGGGIDAFVTELDPWGEKSTEASPAVLARSIQPGIPVIYTTVEPGVRRVLEPETIVIEKPFEVGVVAQACRQVLLS